MAPKAKNLCRFTRELDEKLIQLVSDNEVLYDTNHKDYKDLNVRDDAWQTISAVVRKPIPECKTRWRSLRDLYHRKKKEQKAGKKIRSSWEYMESMSFLENFTSEKHLSSEKRTLPVDINDDYEEENSQLDIKLEYDAMQESHSMPGPSHCPVSPPEERSTPTPSKKRRLDEHSTILQFLRELARGRDDPILTFFDSMAREERATPPPSKKPRVDEQYLEQSTILQFLRELARGRDDPILSFFDCMAKTVVRFPPAQAAEVRLKVCQIVTEIECRIQKEDT